MGIISWIFFGGIAGWIASIITGKNRQMGKIANIIVGVIGASIGGFLGNLAGLDGHIDRFSIRNLAVAVVGSVLLLSIGNLFGGRRR